MSSIYITEIQLKTHLTTISHIPGFAIHLFSNKWVLVKSKLESNMSQWTKSSYLTEILLKTWLNIIQSIYTANISELSISCGKISELSISCGKMCKQWYYLIPLSYNLNQFACLWSRFFFSKYDHGESHHLSQSQVQHTKPVIQYQYNTIRTPSQTFTSHTNIPQLYHSSSHTSCTYLASTRHVNKNNTIY